MKRRLGLYVDTIYEVIDTVDGRHLSPSPIDFGFLLFACEVGARFDRLLLFGRTEKSDSASARGVLETEAEIVELPYYRDLRQLGKVATSIGGTVAAFWRGLSTVDIVWVFGPHPFSLLLIGLALARRRRVVLGVRQDTIPYFRMRLPSARWSPTLVAVRGLDATYRLLARRLGTTVVGEAIARRYGGARGNLLAMTVSIVRADDIAREPCGRDWERDVELLTVARLEPEKNPFLLLEMLAALESASPGRYRLTWVGSGRLEEDVRKRAVELGVAERLELCGFVPFGSELFGFYRRAHAFVHVSLTEGLPQVLIEALACGTPVIATDVGGVGAALANGEAGLLVPPDDLESLLQAVLRLSEDPRLRWRLAAHGLELARAVTLEAQAERVARFIANQAAP